MTEFEIGKMVVVMNHDDPISVMAGCDDGFFLHVRM